MRNDTLSKTCHIITISLSEGDKDQTFSSLAYGQKVGSIYNTPTLPTEGSVTSQRRSVSQKSVFKTSKVYEATKTPNVRAQIAEPQSEETFFNLQLQRGTTGEAGESSLNYPSKMLDKFSAVAREDAESVSQPNTYRQRLDSNEPSLVLFPQDKVYARQRREQSLEVRLPQETSTVSLTQLGQMGQVTEEARDVVSARYKQNDTMEDEPQPRKSQDIAPVASPAKRSDPNPYAKPRSKLEASGVSQARGENSHLKTAKPAKEEGQRPENLLESTNYNSRKHKKDSAHTGLKYSSNNPHSWIDKCTSLIADTDTELKALRIRIVDLRIIS